MMGFTEVEKSSNILPVLLGRLSKLRQPGSLGGGEQILRKVSCTGCEAGRNHIPFTAPVLYYNTYIQYPAKPCSNC